METARQQPSNASKNGHTRQQRQDSDVTLKDVSTELEYAAESLARASERLKQIVDSSQRKNGGRPQRASARAAPELDERLTVRQLAAIHAAARRVGLDHEKLEERVHQIVGKPTPVACLTREQASRLLDTLNGASYSR